MNSGDTLAHYRIEERVGAGGMGEVYKARDTKLNRTVALKLLAAESVSDPQRRERLVREARAASALDHPNIITIHDIAEAEGQHFIVMQYVKGRTLRDLIGDGLELSKSLDYAVQIADGLDAAHTAGIVHRDLKPDNVNVDDDGRVKILDFGVAKLTEPQDVFEAETRDQVHLTQAGSIVGTTAYMSPEQAEGDNVDARSDIFSFGSMLYEMVTGQRAFEGDNVASVMAAIIRDDPRPVTHFLSKAPRDFDAFFGRLLAKEPGLRFSSMREVKSELERLRSAPRVRSSTWRMPRWVWAALSLVLVVVLYDSIRDRLEPPLPPPRVVPVTSYRGYEMFPALSPDGSRVAFERNLDVYVQLLGGGDALRLTDTSNVQALTWTPDAQRITFLRSTDTEPTIYSVPALGGAETRITSLTGFARYALGLSWSPDGKLLAYVDRDEPDSAQAIFLFGKGSEEAVRLTNPPAESEGDLYPAFSPNGERIAFVRMDTTQVARDIYVKDSKGGNEVRLTWQKQQIDGIDWSADGRSIVYALERTLYRVADSGGEPRLVEGVEGEAYSPSVSRTGSFLVYSQSAPDWNIWRAPVPGSE